LDKKNNNSSKISLLVIPKFSISESKLSIIKVNRDGFILKEFHNHKLELLK
jgi:hypothetical protein